MVYPNNGAVLEGLRAGNVDVVFTNATAARAKEIDFTQPYLEVEAGYLVPQGSSIATLGNLDKPGVRVGVMEGSTSSTTLPTLLKSASVVRVPTIDKVTEMLSARTLDASRASLVCMSTQTYLRVSSRSCVRSCSGACCS